MHGAHQIWRTEAETHISLIAISVDGQNEICSFSFLKTNLLTHVVPKYFSGSTNQLSSCCEVY